jgi:preprotein translocase YajC subunit
MPDWITWLIIPVVVILIGVMWWTGRKQKKAMEAKQEGLKEIGVGDNVKTQLGVYGKIISITETTDGKICIIETGAEGAKSTIECHFSLIAGLDEKYEVRYEGDRMFKKVNGVWEEVIIDTDPKTEEIEMPVNADDLINGELNSNKTETLEKAIRSQKSKKKR